MKFYGVVVEKHSPFRDGRDGQKIIHLLFFVQLCMRCIQLGSHSHGENDEKFLNFCILKLSNVLFQNTQQRVLL